MNKPAKVLVVDDEELLRKTMRLCLETLGLEVIEAENGREGLAQCLSAHPDLVMLDINMPEMNGFELCRHIKRHPDLAETPVIFLSGQSSTHDLLVGFASGAVDYVSKPFRLEEIKARVSTHLEVRRQRQHLEDSQRRLQEALSEVRKEQKLLIEVNARLLQSEQVKSHFIAHMRNEINDPLGSILGLADELNHSQQPLEMTREIAGRIRDEAFHLDFQLRNIFCASELEAGEASPTMSMVDMESVIRQVALVFESRLAAKEQALSITIAEDARQGMTDARLLRIVIANLLANAIEFSPKGGAIDLRLQCQGQALLLEVQDFGIGMSEAEIRTLFERFRYLDPGHDRDHKGQGLGLAVVKALVELLEGELRVDSTPGAGSTFTCRLPLNSPSTGTATTIAFDGNLFLFEGPTEP